MNVLSKIPFASILFAAVVALAASTPHVDAANVNWGAPQGISSASDVSTNGTLVGAANLGDTGVPSATVNGVTFQSLAAPLGNGSSGIFAITTVGGGSADNSGGASANAPFTTLSAGYQTLLSSFVGSVFSSTLSISGLIIGFQYELQVWTNRSGITFNNEVTLTAGNSVALSANPSEMDGGLGQWVIGTFTADAATQSFTFGGDGEVRGLVNGVQLRRLTQPSGVPDTGSTLALLGGAFAAIALLRRNLIASAV